ncbi:aconitase X [Mesorhizobium sp. LMG17149]|uniref:aconitase X n=1 Tax=Mesorhizobium sp. LMG17149 TaxID=2968497 RepID=UPI0021176D42|nr:aconitase X [Mesorhizobium sp. LMG17149]MCQ8873348.1 aconitase X [Mesorhizobium sp. LMG17149]
MTLELTAQDRAMLDGEQGPSAAAAMKILVAFSNAVGAGCLLDIAGAHIDGCLYHGKAGLDFVERLVEGGGRVQVPTTLNVGSFDLIHPGMVKMPLAEEVPARRLMKAHLELGCQATFTCAPYQTRFRPSFGQQIAWGESNAIVFANSVIGARTNRYGDFIDLCCAMTGRAPAWGLHLSENRRGRILFELDVPDGELSDSLFVGVGLIIGQASGDRVPVIAGLPRPRDEDQLKALGAAAATTGAVALFHAVGITPEAMTLDEAFQGHAPDETIRITRADIDHALARLSSVPDGSPLAAVSLGTPHFSHAEWMRLLPLLREEAPGRGIPIYVNTGRATLTRLQEEGALDGMAAFGLIPVADTCTYVTSILERLDGVVMTNSGKWAHYAPGNIGVSVAFAEMEDCIRSAAVGHVVRSVS